jgi:hypothetical protein
MNLQVTAVLLLILEVLVTISTAHQHHSEAKWEISATYFGNAVGYVLERFIIWLPLALLLFLAFKLRHRGVVMWRLAGVSLTIELAVTIGSVFLHARDPSYGIFYRSFLSYLIARAVFWIPLTCAILLTLSRRPNLLLRRNAH